MFSCLDAALFLLASVASVYASHSVPPQVHEISLPPDLLLYGCWLLNLVQLVVSGSQRQPGVSQLLMLLGGHWGLLNAVFAAFTIMEKANTSGRTSALTSASEGDTRNDICPFSGKGPLQVKNYQGLDTGLPHERLPAVLPLNPEDSHELSAVFGAWMRWNVCSISLAIFLLFFER